jgi:hypothetical protein
MSTGTNLAKVLPAFHDRIAVRESLHNLLDAIYFGV